MNIWFLVGLVAAFWVIYDVFSQQKKMRGSHKVIWTICALMFSIITAIAYYIIIKRK